jgi:hypothetical protein
MIEIPPTSDLARTATSFTSTPSSLRYRFGTVVSIEADRTCTITIGGDTTQISGVRYLAPPRPNAPCIIAVDGLDLFVVGQLGAATGTLAPRASRSTNQSIPDATDTAIAFDAVQSDAWQTWILGNQTRMTAPLTGRYMATGSCSFAGNATGFRAIWIDKDGTTDLARVQVTNAGGGQPTWLAVTTHAFDMTQGDYIRLMVRQTSGGALAVQGNSTFSPALSLIYLGP